jgi:hypothetical protein
MQMKIDMGKLITRAFLQRTNMDFTHLPPIYITVATTAWTLPHTTNPLVVTMTELETCSMELLRSQRHRTSK